jgi:hypothetical protein
MATKPSYLAAAFNAKPLGMPVAPNWFVLAAFGLLGAFVSPGFWLMGLGLEIAYLWGLSRHPRFRAFVDARSGRGSGGDDPYPILLQRLGPQGRRQQKQIEDHCAQIIDQFRHSGALDIQFQGLAQLAWLHLRLLVAQQSLVVVVNAAHRENAELTAQQAGLGQRLSQLDIDEALKRSLEQQLAVVRSRLDAHHHAHQRLELVNAELERIRQQVALVHEQSLLATDAEAIAQAIDVLAASLNQASVLFHDQQEVLSSLDDGTGQPPEALRRAMGKPPAAGNDRGQLKQEDI